MSTVKQIFLSGEAGYHNLGDEGMALASASRLKSYFPDAKLVATGLDAHGAVLRHQAKIVPWPLLPSEVHTGFLHQLVRKYGQKIGANESFLDPFARSLDITFDQQYKNNERFRGCVSEIERSEFVFDMGHGALNDVFNPFMLCIFYYMAKKLRKPLFISGQSIGPLWKRSSLDMLRKTLPWAHTVGLRDHQVSMDILIQQLDLSPAQVNMVEIGDDTLDLIGIEPDWLNVPTHIKKIIQSREFVAVQWRSSDYSNHLGETEQLIPFSNLIKTIYEISGLPVIFVPLSWEMNYSDILAATRIYNHLCQPQFFHVLWNYMEASHVKWILGHARFGVGLSYHFHMFSLSQGVPTIPLFTNPYYEIKLKGVVAGLGHKIAPINYSVITENQDIVIKSLDDVLNWCHQDRKRLLLHAEKSRQAWHQAFKQFITDNGLRKDVIYGLDK